MTDTLDQRTVIARAIFDADRQHIDSLNGFPDEGQPEWDEAYDGIKQNCYREADAVLTALDELDPAPARLSVGEFAALEFSIHNLNAVVDATDVLGIKGDTCRDAEVHRATLQALVARARL